MHEKARTAGSAERAWHTIYPEKDNKEGSMKQEKDKKRRSFLKHVLAGGVVLAGTAAAVRPAGARSGPVQPESEETLYRESAEFSKYYKSLRS